MFEPSAAPRVFFLPPGAPFAAELARGLRDRLCGAPPEAMAGLRLYLNARRTARATTEALEVAAPALWLPDIRLVSDLGEEARAAGLAPPPARLARSFALLRLTEAFLAEEPGFGPAAAAPGLAASLRDLLDVLQGAGVGADALCALDLGEHAEHWQRAARFLAILAEHWPRHLAEAEGGALDPEARRAAAAAAEIARWQAAPPVGPVLAAGSTGSTPATAALLAAVARLPQGAVILPGWDPAMPDDVWDALAAGGRPEHPHHHLVGLLAGLGLGPRDPRPWTGAAAPSPARLALSTLALRPAPVTDAWAEALPELAGSIARAVEGLTWIEADHPREEAAAIALLLAEAAHAPGATAALVTPDRDLARRVATELGRWGIVPDDSAGRPLALTPPGIVLGLLARALGRPLETATLAALLRHPLSGGRGSARRAHAGFARALERRALRGGPAEVDWARIEETIGRARAAGASLPAGFDAWLAALRAALEPLARPAEDAAEAAHRHIAAAEALSAGPEGGPPPLWDGAAGAAARGFAEAFAEAAAEAPPSPLPPVYGALWSAFVEGEAAPDPAPVALGRIRLLGALEARAETAALTVLGGLNEGTWPPAPGPDPWLGRELRRRLGLPSPEGRVGLSAHDFLQALNAPRAVVSRARRDDAGPTVASRWLARLEALTAGADRAAGHAAGVGALAEARARGEAVLTAVRGLDRLPEGDPRAEPASRPMPTPPFAARPRRLSVTQIETLVRDPYAIYARHVLGLRPLDPLGRAPDARERGTILHAALQRFGAATADWPAGTLPSRLAEALMAAADATLAEAAPWPAERRLWRARFRRAADWFAQGEVARRADGARPVLLEGAGRTGIAAPGGPFTLTARADRIDLGPDGRAAIYDYKTGKPPSDKQVLHFARQLLLQALILEDGGFEGMAATVAARLEYVGLTGTGEGGESRVIDPEALPTAETRAGLAALIAAYDRAETPYAARLRPALIAHAGDYDRLSRFGEWAGEDAEGAEA